jgi:vacuolar-type H+-ATPase catalytic subunit A/Vma1
MQSAFDEVDTYCSLEKSFLMLKSTVEWFHKSKNILEMDEDKFEGIVSSETFKFFSKMKTLPNESINEFSGFLDKINQMS